MNDGYLTVDAGDAHSQGRGGHDHGDREAHRERVCWVALQRNTFSKHDVPGPEQRGQ